MSLLGRRQRLHRARVTLAEPLRRELRLPHSVDELLAVELFSGLTEAQVLIEDWRQDYNQHRPHSTLEMMTPVAFAASLRQLLPGPTATTAEEGIEQRCRQTNPGSDPQAASFQPRQQHNPAEDISVTASQANSHSSYRASTTTTTQLSQRVDP